LNDLDRHLPGQCLDQPAALVVMPGLAIAESPNNQGPHQTVRPPRSLASREKMSRSAIEALGLAGRETGRDHTQAGIAIVADVGESFQGGIRRAPHPAR
jgi:hypothetical protein